jgi:hypothetical protein
LRRRHGTNGAATRVMAEGVRCTAVDNAALVPSDRAKGFHGAQSVQVERHVVCVVPVGRYSSRPVVQPLPNGRPAGRPRR